MRGGTFKDSEKLINTAAGNQARETYGSSGGGNTFSFLKGTGGVATGGRGVADAISDAASGATDAISNAASGVTGVASKAVKKVTDAANITKGGKKSRKGNKKSRKGNYYKEMYKLHDRLKQFVKLN